MRPRTPAPEPEPEPELELALDFSGCQPFLAMSFNFSAMALVAFCRDGPRRRQLLVYVTVVGIR